MHGDDDALREVRDALFDIDAEHLAQGHEVAESALAVADDHELELAQRFLAAAQRSRGLGPLGDFEETLLDERSELECAGEQHGFRSFLVALEPAVAGEQEARLRLFAKTLHGANATLGACSAKLLDRTNAERFAQSSDATGGEPAHLHELTDALGELTAEPVRELRRPRVPELVDLSRNGRADPLELLETPLFDEGTELVAERVHDLRGAAVGDDLEARRTRELEQRGDLVEPERNLASVLHARSLPKDTASCRTEGPPPHDFGGRGPSFQASSDVRPCRDEWLVLRVALCFRVHCSFQCGGSSPLRAWPSTAASPGPTSRRPSPRERWKCSPWRPLPCATPVNTSRTSCRAGTSASSRR